MKKILSALSIIALLITGFSLNSFGQCEDKKIAKACKPLMKPYKYDAYAVNELKFDKKPKKTEVQFTVYEGTNYRLVFCPSGFKEDVKLNVFDKSRSVKSRKPIYEGGSRSLDSKTWVFEPSKTGTYYIEYDVPIARDSIPKTGCVVLLIGFK